jgi:probable lipoprotein (TIGR04455 family)
MRFILIALFLASMSCSALKSSYLAKGYGTLDTKMVKRIAIAGWTPKNMPEVDELLVEVSSDRLALKTNYMIYRGQKVKRSWSELCEVKAPAPSQDEEDDDEEIDPETLDVEGVLLVRLLDAENVDKVYLHLSAELYDCGSGAVVWRARGEDRLASDNEDLAALTKGYLGNVGASVKPFVVPVFLVLRDLFNAIPNPVLNESDVLEKIEYGL